MMMNRGMNFSKRKTASSHIIVITKSVIQHNLKHDKSAELIFYLGQDRSAEQAVAAYEIFYRKKLISM